MKIDLHCHIDLFDNPFDIVNRCESEGIFTIAVSNTPNMFIETKQHLSHCKYVHPALGIHPTIKESMKEHLKPFCSEIDSTAFVGEIGLDGTVAKDRQIEQREVFEKILNICAERNCILSVHSRKMESIVLSMIREFYDKSVVFHWYSGSSDIAEKIVCQEHYFSVNLAMLNKEHSRRKIQLIPKDRILTESDGPFAMYRRKPLSPLDIHETLLELSNLWSVSPDEAEQIVENNFRRLLKTNCVSLPI